MKLLVGLGNPGKNYQKNRHNIGRLFAQSLIKGDFRLGKKFEAAYFTSTQAILAYPLCFMNESGGCVKKLLQHFKIKPANDLLVIHDDLDIRLEDFKLQYGKGPKKHNGLISIEEKLATQCFWRLRIGVDNRDSQNRKNGEEYVLEDFRTDELESLQEVFKQIIMELSLKGWW